MRTINLILLLGTLLAGSPTVADVMLGKGASANVVRGAGGSVGDPGAGNQVQGLTRLAR